MKGITGKKLIINIKASNQGKDESGVKTNYFRFQ